MMLGQAGKRACKHDCTTENHQLNHFSASIAAKNSVDQIMLMQEIIS